MRGTKKKYLGCSTRVKTCLALGLALVISLLMGWQISSANAQSNKVGLTITQPKATNSVKADSLKLVVADVTRVQGNTVEYKFLTNTNKPNCNNYSGGTWNTRNPAFPGNTTGRQEGTISGDDLVGYTTDSRWVCVRLQDTVAGQSYYSSVAFDVQPPTLTLKQWPDSTAGRYTFRIIHETSVTPYYIRSVSGQNLDDCTAEPSTKSTTFPQGWVNTTTWQSASAGSVTISVASGDTGRRLCVAAQDAKGNKVFVSKSVSDIDTTGPTITVPSEAPQNPTLEVSINDTDTGTGVKRAYYRYTSSATARCDRFTDYKTESVSQVNGDYPSNYVLTLKKASHTQDYVCLKAEDAVENETYYDSDDQTEGDQPVDISSYRSKTIYVDITRGHGSNPNSPVLTANLRGLVAPRVVWKSTYNNGACTNTDPFVSGTTDSATGITNKINLATNSAKVKDSDDSHFCFYARTNNADYFASTAIGVVDTTGPSITITTPKKDQVAASATDAGSGVDKATWAYELVAVADGHCTNDPSKITKKISHPPKLTLDARHNNYRVCFVVKDNVGNYSPIVAHIFTSNTAPTLTVTQTNNRLTYNSDATQLAYARTGLATAPNCETLAASKWTNGKPILAETDNGKYICFRAYATPAYKSLKISGVDKTEPSISIVQNNTQLTASALNEAGTVSWKYFKTTGTTAPTNCSASYDWSAKDIGSSNQATLTAADSGKYICFRAVDATGNTSYKNQQLSAVDTDDPSPTPVAAVTFTRDGSQITASVKGKTISKWLWYWTDNDYNCDDTHLHFSKYLKGTNTQSPATGNQVDASGYLGKYICFRATDSANKVYYGEYKVPDKTDDGTSLTPVTPGDQTTGKVTVAREGGNVVASLPSDVTASSWLWYWTHSKKTCDGSLHFDNYLKDTDGYRPQPTTGNTVDVSDDSQNRYYCFRATDTTNKVYYGQFYNSIATADDPAEEPATEPATEPAVEPATEPATEPAVEPATDPASDPATEDPATTDKDDADKKTDDGESGFNFIWIVVGGLVLAVILVIFISSQGSRGPHRE